MTTRLWAVRTALVTVFGTAVDPTAVHDGPLARADNAPKSFLLVGTDGGGDGTGDDLADGAVVNQKPSLMANGWREEDGTIECAAWAWSGGTDFVPLRAALAEMVDACEAALLADPTLGGILAPQGYRAEFTGPFRTREVQTAKGAVARSAFIVAYRALIT